MRLAGRQLAEPLLIAGVGNRDRADDGFGPALARRLLIHGWGDAIDCGDRLEDFTLDIALKNPRTILVVDAVDMGTRPGQMALFEISDLPWACHAHAPSLRLAMEYLRVRTDAAVLLLGVQPGRVCEGQGLSREVTAALNEIVQAFTEAQPAVGKKKEAPFPFSARRQALRGYSNREDEWASRTR